jgi:hypothetical protein
MTLPLGIGMQNFDSRICFVNYNDIYLFIESLVIVKFMDGNIFSSRKLFNFLHLQDPCRQSHTECFTDLEKLNMIMALRF